MSASAIDFRVIVVGELGLLSTMGVLELFFSRICWLMGIWLSRGIFVLVDADSELAMVWPLLLLNSFIWLLLGRLSQFMFSTMLMICWCVCSVIELARSAILWVACCGVVTISSSALGMSCVSEIAMSLVFGGRSMSRMSRLF